jgi:hypothetical protein
MKRTVVLWALLPALLPVLAVGQSALVEDQQAEPGYQHFYNLEFPEALVEFRVEVAKYPNSPDAYNHVSHAILYREMFSSWELES